MHPADQFWLMTGDVPAGPFTVAGVHTELAAGRATWQTQACAVGGHVWLPIVRTPGLGPVSHDITPSVPPPPVPIPLISDSPAAAPAPAPVVPHSPPLEPLPASPPANRVNGRRPPNNPVRSAIEAGFVIALAVGALYLVYEWVRPLTPTEVCLRIDAAKTAADAKRYATTRMHPFLDAMFADKSPTDPNDEYEWTQEVNGPRPDTKKVGLRGATFVPEAGQRIRIEGYILLVKADGWKADDFVVTGVEGASLPGPVSLADEYARPKSASTGILPGGKAGSSAPAGRQPATSKSWSDRIWQYRGAGFLLFALGGAAWKWLSSRSATPANGR